MATLSHLARPIFALVFAAAVAACSSASPDAAAPPVESAEAAEPAHEAGGLHGFLAESITALDVRPDQKVIIDQARADLRAKSEPMRQARRDLELAVADAVAKGAIDEAALAAPMSRLTTASEAFQPALQAMMNKLHATLDPSQRAALVASMKTRAEGRHGAFHGGGPKARMQKLTAELGLSDTQVQTIRASFAAHAGGERGEMKQHHGEMHGRMQAIATAFQSDTFDAAALGVGREMPAMANARPMHHVRFLSQVVPVLTPAQRTRLADSIRTRAAAHAQVEGEPVEE